MNELQSLIQHLLLEEKANGSDRVAKQLEQLTITTPEQLAEQLFDIYYEEMSHLVNRTEAD